MFKLFLKIAIRYLLKNKLYSFINIFGLALGVASFVLIMLYVNHERSFDRFEGSENVYRVYMDYLEGGEFVPGDANAYIVSGPTLKTEFPEILEFARLRYVNDVLLVHQNTLYEHMRGSLADSTYFDIFNRSLAEGDIESALSEPFTIVLTETLAKKIFGNENPLGKTLKIGDNTGPNFTVSGVLEHDFRNTHIKNDFLVSFKTFYSWDVFENDWNYTWNQNAYFTYLKVDPLADAGVLKQKIMDFEVEGLANERHNMEPMEDIHLYSDKPYEAEANGSIDRVRFLMAIALIIIVLSWLNYVNLATAKSLERAKETGIRKVAGARRPQIVLQTFLESLLLNTVAMLIAMALVVAVLPKFNAFIDQNLALEFNKLSDFLPIVGFITFGTLVSGLYPAIVVSNYAPARALKGKVQASGAGLSLRRGLIFGQFLATIILLIGTFLVMRQIRYLQNQPIGADLEQVVALNGNVLNMASDSMYRRGLTTVQDELRRLPFVAHTTTAVTYPGGGYDNLSSSAGITFPDGTRDDKRITYNYGVGPDYFDLMDFNFLAGGPFKKNSKAIGNEIVMNEKFVRFMGISNMEDAVDKTVRFWDQDWVIAGVIEDYHHFGLKTGVEPMMLRYDGNKGNILVKLDQSALTATGIDQAVSRMERTWKQVFPQSTFNYKFLDSNFEAQYKEDKAFGSAFLIFTILAIIIASLGLFGLTSYTCIQRKKEIGIRKVNGATIGEILALLNIDFVKWVGLAFLVAIPLSWLAMRQWLEGFAYRTDMSWWIFVLAGIVVLAIALLTVSWQSFRAAVANPVDALRDE